ncbi:MAG TPA: hypothetical protein QF611_12005 [Pseudomonadales bacterium]|nr:hypothetical protein [Pseudomonadales bacterium]HJP51746.1 hypothetical protein [Pseudomonadales bacterium]
MVLRVIHILTGSVLLGGFLFDQSASTLTPWLWGAAISGMTILIIDMHASFAILFELRGIAVLTKIILLLLINIFFEQRILLMMIILTIGVLSSHMSKKYRHQLFFFAEKIVSDKRRG